MSQLKIKDGNTWLSVQTGGVGVPVGGNSGQVLAKSSNSDYATTWGDIIYVGDSQPTDPSVKMWLDTDEAGMSAVSSVNAKTGTVVLDADDVGGMSKWDLLWENASPTSAFAAQTVALDLSNYQGVVIETMSANTAETEKVNKLCLFGFVGTTLSIFAKHTSSAILNGRAAAITTTGITFGGGLSEGNSSNNYGIPYRIYGIKGAITT